MGEQQLTRYVVLLASVDNSTWEIVGMFQARDAEQAVKAAAPKIHNDEFTAVAMPARSWNPVPVVKKVETTFVIGGAS